MKLVLATALALAMSLPGMAEGARDRADVIVPEGWQNAYENWHYAPAVKIDGRIYVSGVVSVPRDGDMKAAYRQAWQAIGSLLEEAGSSLDDIVDITTFHTNLRPEFPEFTAVKDEFIRKPYPAWTAIGVDSLLMPEANVEIKVIAHLPE
ncbi:RidA family protein [Kordiimonas aestuarii]|uniref:RidA family protein n=1 Tax=Kordiimonas aestuarii TaxID=1005925 RepID=UPI0021CF63A2|nr:RidA family protein [Kordiimonas aestuarii]